jgi:uncharacterized protein (DUF934 family)
MQPMTSSAFKAEIRNINEQAAETRQNLPLEEWMEATRRDVRAVGVQVAGMKEDLTRVAGQVARLHTLLARLVPADGRKRHV